MRRFSLLILAAIAMHLTAGCNNGPENKWRGLTPPAELANVGLTYYWDLQLTLQRGDSLRQIYLLDQTLYALTVRNELVALDAASGLVKWRRVLADSNKAVFRPIHVNAVLLSPQPSSVAQIMGVESVQKQAFDTVMINSISNVLVLDRSSGNVLRNIPLESAASAGGASDGEYYYVPSSRGWYHAILLQEAVAAWTRSVGGMISAPLAAADGVVYVGGTDGTFQATKAGRRFSPLWGIKLGGPITAEFYVDARGCFVPCEDNRLYALATHTGVKLWEPLVTEGPLRTPVQVSERNVYQYAERDRFYVLDLATGRLRWTLDDARAVMAEIQGQVYLSGAGGKMMVVDEALGQVKASMPMTGMQLFARNTRMAAMFTACRDGRLFCIRPAKALPLSPATPAAAPAAVAPAGT